MTDSNTTHIDQLKHLGQESSLSVTGIIRTDDRSVGGHGIFQSFPV